MSGKVKCQTKETGKYEKLANNLILSAESINDCLNQVSNSLLELDNNVEYLKSKITAIEDRIRLSMEG